MASRIIVTLAAVLLVSACTTAVDGPSSGSTPTGGDAGGGGDGPPESANHVEIDTAGFCKLLVNTCQEAASVPQCIANLKLARFSRACADAVPTATCDAIGELETLCLPTCTDATPTCNGDGTIATCNDDGRALTISCRAGCIALGSTYTGTCGTTHPTTGETSTNDKCWCTN